MYLWMEGCEGPNRPYGKAVEERRTLPNQNGPVTKMLEMQSINIHSTPSNHLENAQKESDERKCLAKGQSSPESGKKIYNRMIS